MRKFFASAQIGPLDATADHILAYLDRPELRPGTKSTYHGHFRAYFDWLVRTGQISTNPVLQTPTPRRHKGVPRPITLAQLGAVLLAVKRRRTRMMIMLASLQGLRVHEIAKIRGQDFDFAAGVLYVTGKGGTTALLPIHEDVAAYAIAAGFAPLLGYWFESYVKPGQPVVPQAVSKAIHDAYQRVGVVATPHQMRHFYGTSLVRAGVSLRVVQELMRHQSLATTQIYTEVDEDQMRAGLALVRLPAA
ncbi:tyrosine-type recombinase/integrase [Arthrobacter sp. HY1533]|uniref:tyrosine-type recombinase/integrase n=1 Tax=Arthrobacter sp. HY1533 TaxID=2970919 RepID=UPI0022B9F5D5|nr:tyrosine-type recombinase/integrase [Arthrobacter sp. HY1533]